MAIQFDSSKVAMFRDAVLANENTIAQLDAEKGGVKAFGQYKGIRSWFSRSNEEKTANNAVRTELLKSLGQAFGLSGMKEEGGKVLFSGKFMDRLEQILGSKVLKRGDFEIDAQGNVKSGKPLTKRRIEAILSKATIECKTKFDLDVYTKKLEVIKKDLGLGPLPEGCLDSKGGKGLFMLAEKLLNMLKNDIFLARTVIDEETKEQKTVYGPKGELIDKSFIRVNPDYTDLLKSGLDPNEMGYPMLQVRGEDGLYKPYNSSTKTQLLNKLTSNEVIHLEREPLHEDDMGSLERQKRYIASIAQQYVQQVINIYFAAKAEGRVEEFLEHFRDGAGACLEDQGKNLSEYFAANFNKDEAPTETLSKKEIADLESAADKHESNGAPQKTDELIYSEIKRLFMTNDEYKAGKDDWEKDYADEVKKGLVGRTAQILKPEFDEDRDQYVFKPVLDIENKPVYRPLTEKDIDDIGPACLHNVFAG